MAGRGLLSRMARPVRPGTRREDEADEVLEHLRALLNSRKGESVTTAEFGILCLTDLLHAFPGAVQVMQKSIRATIQDFEPRLKNVTVRHVPTDDQLTLTYEISAQLVTDGRRVRFNTQLRPHTRVNVW